MRQRKPMTINEWVDASGLHYTEIAEMFGMSVSQFYRILQGQPTRPKTAKRIELATGGRVKAATLLGIEA